MVLEQVSRARGHASAGNLLVFSENRGQPADLGAKGCSHMLRLVRNKLFDAGHHLAEERIALEEGTEAYENRQ